jgi:hypothetical protein
MGFYLDNENKIKDFCGIKVASDSTTGFNEGTANACICENINLF